MTSVFPNKKVLEQEYKDLSGLLSNIVDSVPMYLFVKDTYRLSSIALSNWICSNKEQVSDFLFARRLFLS